LPDDDPVVIADEDPVIGNDEPWANEFNPPQEAAPMDFGEPESTIPADSGFDS